MTRTLGLVFTCICLLHVSVGILNPGECRSLMDLFFVIDGSDSISIDDFGRLKEALSMMIQQTDLGPNKARIGMLVYSSDIPIKSKHPFSSDRKFLLDAAATLQHPRDGTKTDLGLKDMIDIFDQYGRNDVNIPKVCITITDGASKNPYQTRYQAQRAAQKGISMFAVGVGNLINVTELSAIASSQQQVKTMLHFSDLLHILTNMMVTICPCPVPPTLPYSKCTEGPRAIGSERWYECEPGYHLVGNPRITCQNDFTWTPISTDFGCIPCSNNTPNVEYGHCLGGENTIGTERTYRCLDGYRPQGNPLIECLKNATWSPPNFNCLPCGEPDAFSFGKCLDGDNKIGSTRKLECYPGYMAVGNPKLTCIDDPIFPTPIWKNPSPFKCVLCKEPVPVANGYCSGGENKIGSERTLACNPGYMAVGNPKLTCIEDWTLGMALWKNPSHFECVLCKEPVPVANGYCSGGENMIGSERTFACNPGYMAVGDPKLTCIEDWTLGMALWKNPSHFECVLCKDPVPVANGYCSGGENKIGSERTLACNPGYMAVGDPKLTCIEDRTLGMALWKNPSHFECVLCKDPVPVANGYCSGGENMIGSERTLACNPGYMAVGDPKLTCIEDRTLGMALWKNPSHFECVLCKDPVPVANGYCSGGENKIGSERTFACNPGYMAVGDPKLTCIEDWTLGMALWKNPSHFECVLCKDPVPVANGYCSDGENKIGSERTLACNPGYMAVGDPKLTCNEDWILGTAVWKTHSPFKCVLCEEPKPFTNGYCSGGENMIGSERTLACNPGYMAVGNPKLTCIEDWTLGMALWKNPSHFECVLCKEPVPVANGYCSGGENKIGSERTFACNPGYMAVGNPTLTCMANWNLGMAIWNYSSNFACVLCKDPVPVANGYCSGGENTIGSERTFACNPGYMAVGNPTLTCMANWNLGMAVWNYSSNFECVSCKEPVPVANGECLDGDIRIGSTRKLVCNTGFRAVGNAVIECIDNNGFPRPQWSTSDFKCLPCGKTPIIPHGSCGDGNYTIGSVRHLTCDDDYFPVGVPRLRCLDDLSYGTPVWTPNYDFRCVICQNPPYIANAYVNGGPTTVGSTRHYACDPQFTMNGPGTLTCNERGEWEGHAFSCDAMLTTTPFPVSPNSSVCNDCRMLNGVGYNNHPSDCNQYVQCYIGTRGMEPIYRRCGFGLFWDQDVLTCQYPEKVKCPHDKCSQDATLGAYKHTDPDLCCAYWECQDGKSSGKCCSEGYSFSSIHNKCVVDATCVNKCPFEDEIPACDLRGIVGKPNKFEQHIGSGFWVEMFCPATTEFNSVTCQCSNYVPVMSPGQPIVPVCTPDLDLNFNHGFDDLSKNKAPVNSLGVTIKDGAAYFDGSSRLLINFFSNNEFGSEVVITFKYKEDERDEYFGDLQALVTNGDCDDDPSIIIAKVDQFVLMGAKAETPNSFAIPTENKLWKEVIYQKSDKILEGQVCGGSRFEYVYGDIRRTKCALQIGYGTGLRPFRGYIDDFKLYRCTPNMELNTSY